MNTDFIISLIFINLAWLLITIHREERWVELTKNIFRMEPMQLLQFQKELLEECELDD